MTLRVSTSVRVRAVLPPAVELAAQAALDSGARVFGCRASGGPIHWRLIEVPPCVETTLRAVGWWPIRPGVWGWSVD